VPYWPQVPCGLGFFYLLYYYMANIAFFVDGFNLYHALENNKYRKYKWLDISKLCRSFSRKQDQVSGIYYFTALTTWDNAKVIRHKNYIKALESKGIKVIYGEFKRKTRVCGLCHKEYRTFEEKQTDVNIAIHLFRYALEGRYDSAIIISGDSDLIPSISAVKTIFPNKSIGIIIPIDRASESLKKTADFHMKMKEYHLSSCLFPNPLSIGQNQSIYRPDSWK
jgi:uncharacterized LabA/DUF88 family protein